MTTLADTGQHLRRLFGALMISTAIAGVGHIRVAMAQEDATTQDSAPRQGWLQIDADTGDYDQNTGTYIAEGNVVVQYEGRTVRADRLVYNEADGEVYATGNVVLTDPSGAAFYSEEARLTDDLESGFIRGIQGLLSDGSQLAAASAERTGGNRSTLSYAVYSPCEICDDKKPLWQIKAKRVIHDQEDRTLRYRHAILEVKGVPVFYLPYFSHPDPTVESRSGMLTPGFSSDSELGVAIDIPLHWAPSRSRDFTLTPKITSNVGVILFGEYRDHIGAGAHIFSGSITRPRDRDDDGISTDERITRGHVFGSGRYDVGNTWVAGFDVAFASDDTYLRRYDISRVDSLTNNLYLNHITDRTYLTINTYAFQSLRQEDEQDRIPLILPMIEYQYRSKPGWNGNFWTAGANILALNRTDGLDMYRMSGAGSWEIPYTNSWGHIFRMTAAVRGDMYLVHDPDQSDQTETEGRAAPSLAMDWSWPFAKVGDHVQHVIEPVASIVLAPDESNPDKIPNEDSIDVQFSDLNLFRHNRSPGFDVWESGVRANYGVRYSITGNSGVQGSFLVGQSWRLSGQSPFPDNSGLDNNRSDLVTGLALSVPGWFDLHHSMRLDEEDLSIEKNQLELYAGPSNFRLQLGYLDVKAQGFDTSLPRREEVNIGAYVKISDEWSAKGSLIQSFDSAVDTIEWAFGVTWDSRCVRIETTLRRNYAEDRDIRPTTSLFVKIALANLGG